MRLAAKLLRVAHIGLMLGSIPVIGAHYREAAIGMVGLGLLLFLIAIVIEQECDG